MPFICTEKGVNFILKTVISSVITGVESCSLPVEWDGEWHDSSDTERDITFTRSSSYVEGWKHTTLSQDIASWTCVDQDTSNNLLLFKLIKLLFLCIFIQQYVEYTNSIMFHFHFRSNQTVDIFGTPHRLYRCIKWEKLTDFSYSYLIYASMYIFHVRFILI